MIGRDVRIKFNDSYRDEIVGKLVDSDKYVFVLDIAGEKTLVFKHAIALVEGA